MFQGPFEESIPPGYRYGENHSKRNDTLASEFGGRHGGRKRRAVQMMQARDGNAL